MSAAAEFGEHSGAPTSATSSGPASGPPGEWVGQAFGLAETQYRGCSGVGGRYWEVAMHTGEYLKSLRLVGEEPAAGPSVAKDLMARLEALPAFILIGVCAPATCEHADVREVVWPRYTANFLFLELDLPPPQPWEFHARELAAWSDLHLDFVIAGLCSCGTTSLRKNLLQHPDIGFTVDAEDQWFVRHSRSLPYREEIQRFNRAWLGRGHIPRIKGLADPSLFEDARTRQVLSRMPQLRVITIICDPVGRVEKAMWVHHLCRENGQSVEGRHCWPSLSAVLTAPQGEALLAREIMGDRLRALFAVVGRRARLLHQDSLRFSPRQTYHGLADFLGAEPFPPKVEFYRYNSRRGHRSELCRNASLLAHLQERLRGEYGAFEELLRAANLSIPAALRLRHTRCDRPEELAGA